MLLLYHLLLLLLLLVLLLLQLMLLLAVTILERFRHLRCGEVQQTVRFLAYLCPTLDAVVAQRRNAVRVCPDEPPESRLNELPERFERLPRLQQLSASECGEWRLLCECRSGSDLWLLMLYDCVGE
uniref:Uncharacterized protein n=1 Tax=Anopheles farauti TaxID=69004 RepID=A0A182QW30_9DIPT